MMDDRTFSTTSRHEPWDLHAALKQSVEVEARLASRVYALEHELAWYKSIALGKVISIEDSGRSFDAETAVAVGDKEYLQRRIDALTLQLAAIHVSAPYRLAQAIIQAVVSPGWNTLVLPAKIARIALDAVRRKRAHG